MADSEKLDEFCKRFGIDPFREGDHPTQFYWKSLKLFEKMLEVAERMEANERKSK